MEIKIQTYKCKRCNHEWVPRVSVPELCPHCKSYCWNKEDKEKITKAD